MKLRGSPEASADPAEFPHENRVHLSSPRGLEHALECQGMSPMAASWKTTSRPVSVRASVIDGSRRDRVHDTAVADRDRGPSLHFLQWRAAKKRPEVSQRSGLTSGGVDGT